MSQIWNASEYDLSRRRLIPCFEPFYTTAADLVAATVKSAPALLDLGAGTGLLSEYVARRVQPRSLHLLDESPEMLTKAEVRLAPFQPTLHIQKFTDPLPAGPFDAVISALAIHHLSHADKRDLFARIHAVLALGGLFVNAEQILGPTPWHERLYEDMHLNGACALGSSPDEIRTAQERMAFDRCAPLADQFGWLTEAGFQRADSFFQWFRFAVYAGWKRE